MLSHTMLSQRNTILIVLENLWMKRRWCLYTMNYGIANGHQVFTMCVKVSKFTTERLQAETNAVAARAVRDKHTDTQTDRQTDR